MDDTLIWLELEGLFLGSPWVKLIARCRRCGRGLTGAAVDLRDGAPALVEIGAQVIARAEQLPHDCPAKGQPVKFAEESER